MKKISQKRFDAFLDFTRNPLLFALAEEVAWYENNNRNLFAVILFDSHDRDFTPLLLARDTTKKIRAIDGSMSWDTLEKAENWIMYTSKKYEDGFENTFANEDLKKKGIDLFIVKTKKSLNPYFNILNTKSSYSSAKGLISEITPHFYDVDGNFVEQFQTTGFESRLWELYLFCYFNEEGLLINKEHNAPDFLLSNGNTKVGVEAVVISEKTNKLDYNVDVEKETENTMPIRYSNSLTSKLNHKNADNLHYWEHSHTKNKPFVIAIADFHQPMAMTWSSTALINYLYGCKHTHFYDKQGRLQVNTIKIEEHIKENGSKVKSGFFYLPESENISAILHCATGTLSKFNRIGKECGFDEGNTTMLRFLSVHNPNPNSDKPLYLNYSVNEKTDELWSEGVSIFHNPNAKNPLPKDFFRLATYHEFKDGLFFSTMIENHVYSNQTIVFSVARDDDDY